jgi:hypothetical protein
MFFVRLKRSLKLKEKGRADRTARGGSSKEE